MGEAALPQLRIGCSGWNYKSWKGRFYPARLAQAGWLRHYAGVFDTVEINNTFYRLPEARTFGDWRSQTPEGFLIAVKASRFITHVKRLRDPDEPLDRLFTRASALGSRLGPVLYQLPGNFHIDLERLRGFLRELPPRRKHVFEFRHPSWYVPDTFELLDRYHVALCLHDKAGSAFSEHPAGPFVYIRFHGPTGVYAGSYSPHALDVWARRIVGWRASGLDVFAYFNNDPDAAATRDAQRLKKRVREVLGVLEVRKVRKVQKVRRFARRRCENL